MNLDWETHIAALSFQKTWLKQVWQLDWLKEGGREVPLALHTDFEKDQGFDLNLLSC